MKRLRVMPPVYLLAAIAAMAALHGWLTVRQLIFWPWRWVGFLPMALGVLTGGWVAVVFVRRKTTITPGEVSSDLVTDGPFRLSRNPIYLGMALILVAVALLLGSLTPWFVIL